MELKSTETTEGITIDFGRDAFRSLIMLYSGNFSFKIIFLTEKIGLPIDNFVVLCYNKSYL